MLQLLHTLLVCIPVLKKRLPRFLLPISLDERAALTQTLMDELGPKEKLAKIVRDMDRIEWYRFFTSLTEASSAREVLGRGRLSLSSLFRAGTRLLEGAD